MPIQKFAPMVKDFATFDCDAHVTEPPWLWERARDYLTKDELEHLKDSIWFDPDSQQLIVNGWLSPKEKAVRINTGDGIRHVDATTAAAGTDLEKDHRGVSLPPRSRVGGIITPQ